MLSLEEIIEIISKQADKPPKQIKQLIAEKQEELSGLVTEEGAAYIVGRELGVSLLKESRRQLKIENLVFGLRSVELVAQVIAIREPYEFQKEERTGRVCNLTIGDETGVCRLSLWDKEIDLLETLKIGVGDTIKITRGIVKIDNLGNPEVRLSGGKLEKADEVIKIEHPENLEKVYLEAKRGSISEFKEGDFGEVRSALVQVYRRNPFYEVCPHCRSRVADQEGRKSCVEHGPVEPAAQMVVSGVIDDGTGNIRAVFFREMAEKVFGDKTENLFKMAKTNPPESVFDHFQGLGRDFIMRGRVKKNDFTGNLEMVVNDVKDVNVRVEIGKLLQEAEAA